MAFAGLSRRERQILEIIYARGRASAAEVLAAMPDPPSYSAVRAMLRILEEKGHVKHQQDGLKYIYLPVIAPERAKRSAMKQLLETFFHDEPDQAVATLLDISSRRLTADELDRMAALIDRARKEGK